jgi:hypothetical protein
MGRQIGGIEYQCLAVGVLTAGRGVYSVRPAKSTARRESEKSRFFTWEQMVFRGMSARARYP